MGVYMSKPIREKESSTSENKLLKCGASSMQGWRVSQEDAHNCTMDFDEDISLFAVYDGHGGHEVAEYASKHLPKYIKESDSYKSGDYEKSLVESFLGFDATLRTEPVIEELSMMANEGKQKKNNNALSGMPFAAIDRETDEDDVDEEGEEDFFQRLKEEADMPLSEVIAKYAEGGQATPPRNKALMGECSKKVLSPYLRATRTSSSSDAEVSSSSGTWTKTSNGEVTESNGQVPDNEVEAVGSSKTEEGSSASAEIVPKSSDDQVSSTCSPAVNGEIPSSSTEPLPDSSSKSVTDKPGSSKDRTGTACLLDDTFSDSDSEEDDSFKGGEMIVSSEDSDEENGEAEEEETEDEDEDDEEVDEEDLKGSDEPGMESGCTAVVALVTKDKLYVANAGDSRGVLSRNGVAVDLSVDHKPEDPIELKRIQAAGGKVTGDGRVNGGLNLSRALGDHFYKKNADLPASEQMITALPDIRTESIDRSVDEFIVLACDGIWNSMTSQEVVDFVRPLLLKGESLSAICEKLFDSCLAPDTLGDGTGCDNMTCVIVQFKPLTDNKRSSPPPSSCPIDNDEPSAKKIKVDGNLNRNFIFDSSQ